MAFYDHFANSRPTALGQSFAGRTAEFLVGEIARLAPPSSSLLEIGPGRGEFCRRWRKKGQRVTVLEPSRQLGVALREEHDLDVVRSFAPPLPFSDDKFDVVAAFHVLEHMSTLDQAVTLVHEMARVCCPGGIVCLVSPDFRFSRTEFWDADYTHNFVTTPRRIEQMVFDLGLSVEIKVLHSAWLKGIPGWAAAKIARLIPVGAFGFAPAWQARAYKLKLTFLRSFLIVARKPKASP